jgi:predicted TIM-barrel fold metal-dependent hydrolase
MHIEQEENVNVNGIDVVINEQRIRSDMDEAGVDMAVLLVMARPNDMERTRGLNGWLAGVCDKEPRFFGFGSVHPYDGDKAIEEMDRCIDDLGLSGFKLHPKHPEVRLWRQPGEGDHRSCGRARSAGHHRFVLAN